MVKTTPGEETVTIIPHPTPARKRVELFNHLLPGVILLIDGIGSIGTDERLHMYSPWLNILAGAGIFVAGLLELRTKGEHAGTDWVMIFAGVVLATEGINIHHPGRWFQPGLLYILLGITYVVFGFLHLKFSRRKIVIRQDRIAARVSPFNRMNVLRSELRSMELKGKKLVATLTDGTTRSLRLSRCANSAEIADACLEWSGREK